MMNITGIVAEREFAGPGVFGYEAEAKVYDPETDTTVYVHAGYYDGFRNYSVSKYPAVGDDLDEEHIGDNLEEYECLDDTKQSKYHFAFKAISPLLTAMRKTYK